MSVQLPRAEQDGFTEEQKSYLQGFWSGFEARRLGQGLPTFAATLGLRSDQNGAARGGAKSPVEGETAPEGPEAIHFHAQNRFLAEGKKLSPEEEAKRQRNPLDIWDALQEHAQADRFPKGLDVFRFKFHGLFYVAPAQDAFMCRLRLPNGILNAHQMRGIASIAEAFGGGYADVTTRANLQVREIRAKDLMAVLTGLQELGIVNRGAGADNIRNITGTPTAGIDPRELIDTRPLARELHHHILNHRELYGLPRKFNIAFDGGGTISALEETNDIGFAAARVKAGAGTGQGEAVPAGVYFRVLLGGITGHRDFGRDTGLLLEPRECVPVAAAMVRVFIEYGDRTDRRKARLKYLLDRWGIEKFLEETQELLPFLLRRFPAGSCEPRGPVLKHGHVGFHPQRQEGLFYGGIMLPAGRMSVEQMRGLAAIAERQGSGTIRLTVWQNLLVSDIPFERIEEVKRGVEALGLSTSATSVRGGLVACTGNKGCRYSATDTKGHALAISEHVEKRLKEARLGLDLPINIHLTGCPHSCAQHSIGDIGLLGTKVSAGEEMVEGYHLFVGGGYGEEQGLGREIYRDVPFTEVPALVEKMVRGYLERRASSTETFLGFVKRHSTESLREVFGQPAAPLAV